MLRSSCRLPLANDFREGRRPFSCLAKSDLRDGWLARNLWFISASRPLPDVKPLVPVPNSIRAEVFGYKNVAGLSRNELTRKTQFIRRSLRDEYLQDLIDGGQVVLLSFSDGHAHGEKLMLADFVRQG